MRITNEVVVHLDGKRLTPTINAVQGDTARAIVLSLYNDGATWSVPSGVSSVVVRFRKDDGRGGAYSKLPNGTTAWSTSGNKVTVALAPQVLTVPGPVEVQVALVAGADILAAFTVIVRVQRDPSIGVLQSEDYINLESWKVLQSELLAKGVTTRIDVSYVSGSINTGTGAEASQPARIRSGYFPAQYNKKFGVIAPSNVKWRLIAYDADLNFLDAGQHSKFVEGSGEYAPKNSNTTFGRLVVGYTDDSEVSDINALASLVTVYYPVEHGGPVLSWYALGDSITQGYYSDSDGLKLDETQGWAALVAKYNGWELTNHAVGGSGYVRPATIGDGLNARDHVDTIDFSNAELVTLAYGVNDWKGDCPLGSMDDDVSTGGTFYSNMRYCIEKILSDCPCVKVVVISPVNCCAHGVQEDNWGIGYGFVGGTLEDFCNAEREICAHYGIEFVDVLHGSAINRENIQSLLPDGVHPTLDCHRLLAVELSRKLMGVNPPAQRVTGGTFDITITGSDADGYTADNDVYDIISADWKGQACVCHWGAVKLPLVRLENEVAYFATVVDGIEYRVEIGPDDNEQTGVVAVSEELGRGVFDVTVTGNDTDGYIADKTYEELRAAEAEGLVLRCRYGTKVLSLVCSPALYVTFGCVINDVSHRVVIDEEQVKVLQTELGGGAEVYIGAEVPTDPNVKVWINPEDHAYTDTMMLYLANKVDKYWGEENKGKALVIGEDGCVTAAEPSGGSSYTLPVATSERLGGVQPVDKTEEMTVPVGVDAAGKLWVNASGGTQDGGTVDSESFETLIDFTAEETVVEFQVPIGTAEIAEKVKKATDIYLIIQVPRDAEDTTDSTGTVTISLYTAWQQPILSNLSIIPNPTETYVPGGAAMAHFTSPPILEGFAYNRCPCLVEYFTVRYSQANSTKCEQSGTSSNIWKYDRLSSASYFTITGTQNMYKGTRFILGVGK